MVMPGSIVTTPSSGCSVPAIMRKIVVLPAPLGPTSPTFSPFWTPIDASMNRIWWPFCLLMLSRQIMGARIVRGHTARRGDIFAGSEPVALIVMTALRAAMIHSYNG